jgi:predicted phosphodiesterase
MQILVLSDIHANLTALEAVLNDAGSFDAVWCLGDLVGYGPDPNECIGCVRMLPNFKCILGNHDAAVLGKLDNNAFNVEARQAIEWTQKELSEEARAFLSDLPTSIVTDQVTLAHGSPRHPVWEYLLDAFAATRSFEFFNTNYCFVGHTHFPVLFQLVENDQFARLIIPKPHQKYLLTPRAIINPGSVGQPRDRDPRAAYAIFTPEDTIWEYRRVAYDIPTVQGRMKTEGLPEKHIQRISNGW